MATMRGCFCCRPRGTGKEKRRGNPGPVLPHPLIPFPKRDLEEGNLSGGDIFHVTGHAADENIADTLVKHDFCRDA